MSGLSTDTDQSEDWGRASGLEAAQVLVRAFVDAVGERVGAAAIEPSFGAAVDAERARLEQAHCEWLVDEPAVANVHMLAAVLAAYRLLDGRLPREQLVALLRECFAGQFRDVIREGTARWFDTVDDPFVAIVDVSRSRERHSFGAGFRF